VISRTNRIGNWGNRKGFDPWRKRKINAAGELWCKNCKDYHPSSEFSPQWGFYQQSCRESRNLILKKSRTRESVCRQCGKTFVCQRIDRRFCSHGCSTKAHDIKNSTAVSRCRNCKREFSSVPRFKQKFCSKKCGYISRRRDPNKALARGKRGPDWPAKSASARQRDGNVCVVCNKSDGKNITVDHIIPYRLALDWSDDPNNLANLACMCGRCHGRKTGIEGKLLRGNVVGFIAGMLRELKFCDQRLRTAMRFVGL
jgi:hypothetical protein